MFAAVGRFFGKGLKAVATGNAQAQIGLQSPHLPSMIVRLGRFFYAVTAGWIAVSWYSGYVNMRTAPGTGPTYVGPGHAVIGPPDRPERQPKYVGAQGLSGFGGGSGPVGPGSGTGPMGGGGRNPWPGATGSRVDQGFDLTSTQFLAPWDSQIVFASNSVSGWQGGGLIAGRVLNGTYKGMVWYQAEGIRPLVSVGQKVPAGTPIGSPVPNPYNGISGNIEAGWANPASPTQPLAQVSANKPAVALQFYHAVRALGAPVATSTGNAGFP